MVLAPWTQAVSIEWRPELRFYEERFALLRALENDGVLRAFRVGQDRVDARVGAAQHQVSIRQDGVSVSLSGAAADLDATWVLVRRAVVAIAPHRFGRVRVALQHLAGLDVSFERAVELGHEKVLALPVVPGLQHGDWALLMDGRGSDDESIMQAEFGIVRSEEVPARLARTAGRMDASPMLVSQPPTDVSVPAVSLFSDSLWLRDMATEPDALDATLEFWESARSRAGTLIDSLLGQLLDDAPNGGS